MQPLYHACTAWFSNLSKRLRLYLQASQNKYIKFCLQLDKRSKICLKEFLQLNQLNLHDRYLQLIVSNIFKFQNNQCPDYFDELFCPVSENGVIMHSSSKKLKLPFRKTKLSRNRHLQLHQSQYKNKICNIHAKQDKYNKK